MPLTSKLHAFTRPSGAKPHDEEERKRLTASTPEEHAELGYDQHQEAAEAYLLNASLRRANVFLKIVIGALIILVLALVSVRVERGAEAEEGVLLSPVPPLPATTVTFAQDTLYASRPGADSDAAWDALLPPGRGFVFIPDAQSMYSLPPGEDTPYGPIYSVALFHQLHCLGQLRRYMWMFLDAITSNETREQDAIRKMFSNGDGVEGHAGHLGHCFDYLRQTIQCAGDMAVEWPRVEEDGRRFAVDGWGIPHQCRGWDAIMEYMDENHFNMSTNAEIAPLAGSSGKF